MIVNTDENHDELKANLTVAHYKNMNQLHKILIHWFDLLVCSHIKFVYFKLN